MREKCHLIHDVRYFPLLSLFVPQSAAFILILVISGSQDDISTTSLTSALEAEEREERDSESGVGPIINSQYSLHASHWPEMHYMTTPSCKGGWVVLP